MKYCLKYTNICTKLNKADEISIKYIEDKGLVDFMEKFKAQRIILRIDLWNFSPNEIRKLIAIRKQYPDLKVIFIPRNFEAKDISDFRKKYGKKKTQQLINSALEYYGEKGQNEKTEKSKE